MSGGVQPSRCVGSACTEIKQPKGEFKGMSTRATVHFQYNSKAYAIIYVQPMRAEQYALGVRHDHAL